MRLIDDSFSRRLMSKYSWNIASRSTGIRLVHRDEGRQFPVYTAPSIHLSLYYQATRTLLRTLRMTVGAPDTLRQNVHPTADRQWLRTVSSTEVPLPLQAASRKRLDSDQTEPIHPIAVHANRLRTFDQREQLIPIHDRFARMFTDSSRTDVTGYRQPSDDVRYMQGDVAYRYLQNMHFRNMNLPQHSSPYRSRRSRLADTSIRRPHLIQRERTVPRTSILTLERLEIRPVYIGDRRQTTASDNRLVPHSLSATSRIVQRVAKHHYDAYRIAANVWNEARSRELPNRPLSGRSTPETNATVTIATETSPIIDRSFRMVRALIDGDLIERIERTERPYQTERSGRTKPTAQTERSTRSEQMARPERLIPTESVARARWGLLPITRTPIFELPYQRLPRGLRPADGPGSTDGLTRMPHSSARRLSIAKLLDERFRIATLPGQRLLTERMANAHAQIAFMPIERWSVARLPFTYRTFRMMRALIDGNPMERIERTERPYRTERSGRTEPTGRTERLVRSDHRARPLRTARKRMESSPFAPVPVVALPDRRSFMERLLAVISFMAEKTVLPLADRSRIVRLPIRHLRRTQSIVDLTREMVQSSRRMFMERTANRRSNRSQVNLLPASRSHMARSLDELARVIAQPTHIALLPVERLSVARLPFIDQLLPLRMVRALMDRSDPVTDRIERTERLGRMERLGRTERTEELKRARANRAEQVDRARMVSSPFTRAFVAAMNVHIRNDASPHQRLLTERSLAVGHHQVAVMPNGRLATFPLTDEPSRNAWLSAERSTMALLPVRRWHMVQPLAERVQIVPIPEQRWQSERRTDGNVRHAVDGRLPTVRSQLEQTRMASEERMAPAARVPFFFVPKMNSPIDRALSIQAKSLLMDRSQAVVTPIQRSPYEGQRTVRVPSIRQHRENRQSLNYTRNDMQWNYWNERVREQAIVRPWVMDPSALDSPEHQHLVQRQAVQSGRDDRHPPILIKQFIDRLIERVRPVSHMRPMSHMKVMRPVGTQANLTPAVLHVDAGKPFQQEPDSRMMQPQHVVGSYQMQQVVQRFQRHLQWHVQWRQNDRHSEREERAERQMIRSSRPQLAYHRTADAETSMNMMPAVSRPEVASRSRVPMQTVVRRPATTTAPYDEQLQLLEANLKEMERKINDVQKQWSEPKVNVKRMANDLYRELSRRIQLEQRRSGM